MKLIRKADYDQYLHDAYSNLKPYVRDVDLSPVCASGYKQGMVICERGFTDVSRRIGGMATTHRYMILSNHMADLSIFEQGTDWGLCVAQCGSHFKVLSIFEEKGKTEILLLHLPDDGRWKTYQNIPCNEESALIFSCRMKFRTIPRTEPIPELSKEAWLNRCRTPLGMDDGGNLFPTGGEPGPEQEADDSHPLCPDEYITEDQLIALRQAENYFLPKHGLANDFIFPGSLLDKLDSSSRKTIEKKIIDCCSSGDTRYLDAVGNIKTVDPRELIDLTELKRFDDDYAKRVRLLVAMIRNTRDPRLLLYLLKMSASNSLAYCNLEDAFRAIDWASLDPESDIYQLVRRTLKTLTCMKRVRIRSVDASVYDRICESGLKQELKTPFLSLQDLAFFTRDDPWSRCEGRDPLVFFRSLEKRAHYLQTKDAVHIRELLKDVLIYPEAYDVLNYMKEAKEISAELLDRFSVIGS